MTLTADEEKLVHDWQLGYGSPGKITMLDLPRTVHGPYKEMVKSFRFTTQNGSFKAGEKVELDGRFLANRVQWALEFRWEVLAFVTNTMNGRQWVDLFGGSPKWAHVFSVPVDAVIKVDAQRR